MGWLKRVEQREEELAARNRTKSEPVARVFFKRVIENFVMEPRGWIVSGPTLFIQRSGIIFAGLFSPAAPASPGTPYVTT